MHTITLADVFLHFLIGTGGAAAGWIGSAWCRHLHHRLAVTGFIVFIESIVSVALVG
jgi:hypothetical protein